MAHKQLRVLAHEPTEAGVIGAGAVFVETERGSVLSPREQETIAHGRSGSHIPTCVVDRWCAENVVSVSLENSAVGQGEKCHAALVILLIIEGPEIGSRAWAGSERRVIALQNLINPCPIQILSP